LHLSPKFKTLCGFLADIAQGSTLANGIAGREVRERTTACDTRIERFRETWLIIVRIKVEVASFFTAGKVSVEAP
jgi:hypothetical protein